LSRCEGWFVKLPHPIFPTGPFGHHQSEIVPVTITPGIAGAINPRNRPSAKQAAQGESVLEEAIQKGLKPAAVQSG
jgi:hypothetical protein